MAKYLTVVPAYGRDYKSAKEVKADWDAGKDFLIQDVGSEFNGSHVNAPQVETGTTVNIRYKRLTMVTVIKVKEAKKPKTPLAVKTNEDHQVIEKPDEVFKALVGDYAEERVRQGDTMLETVDQLARALADMLARGRGGLAVEDVSKMVKDEVARVKVKAALHDYSRSDLARYFE